MNPALRVLVGPAALTHVLDRGLHASDIEIVVGASGGPKWLALAALDRVLFGRFLAGHRTRPLHLIGSSIGSWRMACLAQNDPVAALDRFEAAYLKQRYSKQPPPDEIARVSRGLLAELLGDLGAREIIANPDRHLHVITARCRGLVGSERRALESIGLTLAAMGNFLSRRTLALHAERVIFSSPPATSLVAGLKDLPTRVESLTQENLADVVMASGSIPLVFPGVRIPGAPAGIYRDGGLIDYHPDLPLKPRGLVLFPHFYSHITPGWFDKTLPWRRSGGRHLAHTVLLAPSADWVAKLPGGKIPDRKDFYAMDDGERVRAWGQVLAAGRQLGEEFGELITAGSWSRRVEPLISEHLRRR